MNIMRARKKPMLDWSLGELGLSGDKLLDLSKVSTTSIEVPIVERKNIIIEANSVEEMVKILVQHLREEGVLGG
jgi:electron transfer flavoprotein alpha/beta subunit